MSPNEARHWYDALLPIVTRGGPIVTLATLIALTISVWWLGGWLRTCVDHNRELTEKLLTQQSTFYAELRLALANCPPPPR